jgi:hypothetical protein
VNGVAVGRFHKVCKVKYFGGFCEGMGELIGAFFILLLFGVNFAQFVFSFNNGSIHAVHAIITN